jgi:hypothetical protein
MNKIPPDSLAGKYLRDRGINLGFAVEHGIESYHYLNDLSVFEELFFERLGWKNDEDFQSGSGDKGVDLGKRNPGLEYANRKRRQITEVKEAIWFPVQNREEETTWSVRVLPDGCMYNDEGKEIRYLFPNECRRPVWIPPETLEQAKNPGAPVVPVEGYFKGLALLQAGALPIAFGGTWISEPQGNGESEKCTLCAELAKFSWTGRTVYPAFDSDQYVNDQVRQAVIRAWILFSVAGVEVRVLDWSASGKKGIDDYLASQAGTDTKKQAEVLARLMDEAKPFIETLRPGAGKDGNLVARELANCRMSGVDREMFAKVAAKRLGISKETLLPKRKPAEEAQKSLFSLVEPWEEEVDGKELLEALIKLILKHVYITRERALTVALWIFWSYLVHEEFVEVSPYLGITAADMRSGKSRLLRLVAKLVPRSYEAGRITEASFYRLIAAHKPTLLLDELHRLLLKYPNLYDLFFLGYEREKLVTLYDQDAKQNVHYDCWGAKAFAYVGRLHEHLRDRTIEVYLDQKPKNAKRARLRETPKSTWEEFARKITRWMRDHVEEISQIKVEGLDVANDRATDNWEWLLAIAEVIDPARKTKEGEPVPYSIQAREAALAEEGEERDEDNEGKQVLKVLCGAFKEGCAMRGQDFENPKTDLTLALKDLCSALRKTEIAPWNDGSTTVDSTWLSKVLRRYRIKSQRMRPTPKKGGFSENPCACCRLKQLRKAFHSIDL